MWQWFVDTFKGNPEACYLASAIGLAICGVVGVLWGGKK